MLTLRKLEEIAIEVIGAPVRLAPELSASDVLGWDSLNNTLIALDISYVLGVELDGWDIAQCPTFGAMIETVNRKLADR